MTKPKVAPYGAWKSPITSDLIVSATIGLGQIVLDGEDIYWLEGRPSEGGRNAIVQCTPAGQISDVTPLPFNARTTVHEYGGGSFLADNGRIYFANFADRCLYQQLPHAAPQPLTSGTTFRYADFVFDRHRNRLICVREDHSLPGEPTNAIAWIDAANGDVRVLVSGADFYATPRLSPDGSKLAWLSWNHPNMPWDGTELWVADIDEREGEFPTLGAPQFVAGGPDESIFQPEWSPDGILHFVSDRTGWWNLYRWLECEVELLCEIEAEFGVPQWVFGQSTYAFISSRQLICTYTQEGRWYLATLDLPERGEKGTPASLHRLDIPYTDISALQATSEHAVFLAGSPTKSTSVVRMHLATGVLQVLRSSSDLSVDEGYLSVPETISFPTEKGLTAYGFLYLPANRDYAAPDSEKPPLVVKSHGGPTAATSNTLNLRIQYWTSRGFAVLDVNYGGSTGYGRPYRQRLKDSWGIVDVDDCANGALYLAERGLVDRNRLAIAGGSAGGYTTLCALTFRDVFKAGASYYGVSDLEALAKDTHKFESRYLDGLIGPYPERRDLYVARSPIHFVDRLACPAIFFQGSEDKVVPPNQAEVMVEALKKKGLPVAYVLYEGEQHGFRRAENIKRTLDGEFYFYARVFGFEMADAVEPIAIENLPHGNLL